MSLDFDDVAAGALGGSSLQESLRALGIMDNRAETISITPPAAAPRYFGNVAAELQRSRLLQEILGDEFGSAELRRSLPTVMQRREAIAALRSNPLWPKLLKAAISVVERQPGNYCAAFVVAAARGYENLMRSCAQKALRSTRG